MTKKEKAKFLAKLYVNNAEEGVNDGMNAAQAYYNVHKSGTRQYGYMVGNLFGNIEMLTRHTISKIKK